MRGVQAIEDLSNPDLPVRTPFSNDDSKLFVSTRCGGLCDLEIAAFIDDEIPRDQVPNSWNYTKMKTLKTSRIELAKILIDILPHDTPLRSLISEMISKKLFSSGEDSKTILISSNCCSPIDRSIFGSQFANLLSSQKIAHENGTNPLCIHCEHKVLAIVQLVLLAYASQSITLLQGGGQHI